MSTTTISLPEDLADELYARKGRGESYADVIERLLAAADGRSAGGEGDDTAAPAERDEPGSRRTQDTTDAEGSPDAVKSFDGLVTAVGREHLPGSGAKLDERLTAFRAVVDHLREQGTATPSAFKTEVYPDHPARHTTGDNPERSWWKNTIYPALRELAEQSDRVEVPDTTGEWAWRSETA